MMRIVALLPMKLISERVPGKNFRELNGKPLFRWVLDTLLEVELIDQIIINTDAVNILCDMGFPNDSRILLRNRKEQICGNEISMNVIIEDDIDNSDADVYFMTHTTNPLLSRETIKEALDLFLTKSKIEKFDSIFSVNKVQTRFYKNGAIPYNHNPDELIPTQYLEPLFEENSNFYIFSKESFKKRNARIGDNPRMFEMSKFESIDIDTEDDWRIATALIS
jgi:CMP-N-acetylneuraminic acid synthetase